MSWSGLLQQRQQQAEAHVEQQLVREVNAVLAGAQKRLHRMLVVSAVLAEVVVAGAAVAGCAAVRLPNRGFLSFRGPLRSTTTIR
jgi:hypothetical protein